MITLVDGVPAYADYNGNTYTLSTEGGEPSDTPFAGNGTESNPYVIDDEGSMNINAAYYQPTFIVVSAGVTVTVEGDGQLFDDPMSYTGIGTSYTATEETFLYIYANTSAGASVTVTATVGGSEPEVDISGTYIGTDGFGNALLTLVIDSTAGTAEFIYNHPMMGPSSIIANFAIVDGAVVLYDPATGEELPPLAAMITLVDGVPAYADYNGTTYTLSTEGGGEEPEEPSDTELIDSLIGTYEFDGFYFNVEMSWDGSYNVYVNNDSYTLFDEFNFEVTKNDDGTVTFKLTPKVGDTLGMADKEIIATPNEYVNWIISIDGIQHKCNPIVDSFLNSYPSIELDGATADFGTNYIDDEEVYAFTAHNEAYDVEATRYYVCEMIENVDGTITLKITKIYMFDADYNVIDGDDKYGIGNATFTATFADGVWTITKDEKATVEKYSKVTELKDGDVVMIVADAYKMALTTDKTGYYNVGYDYSAGFDGVTDSMLFVVTVNSDGTYTFTSKTGKVIALADSYTSLNDEGANTSWALTAKDGAEGVFYVKNTVRNLYLEWYASYSNWSTFSNNSDNQFEISFLIVEAA